MRLRTRTHERLAKGEAALGAVLYLNSPEAAEFVAEDSQLDWFCLDGQHSLSGVAEAANILRAVQAVNSELTPFARVPNMEKPWIEKILDMGYVGLIIPLVESKEQAEQLVQAACYPPLGKRSWGGNVRAMLYKNYLQTFNDHLILLPQVESKLGLKHCEAIVNVPGVSGVLFGPGDMSLDMRWPLDQQWKGREFMDAVRHIVGCCRRAGKIAATLLGSSANVPAALEAGFNCLTMASDVVQIRSDMKTKVNTDLERLRKLKASV